MLKKMIGLVCTKRLPHEKRILSCQRDCLEQESVMFTTRSTFCLERISGRKKEERERARERKKTKMRIGSIKIYKNHRMSECQAVGKV